uniref:Uncharacterized protein n=1 Tax=Timema tahoe TaxID=61484 RepID=A0A7R9IGM8_9NEOP|nr:unnamed protein product [Timema tahoe]
MAGSLPLASGAGASTSSCAIEAGGEIQRGSMERWSGRVALVTGASSGIGAGVAKELVKQGLKVVGVARRVNKIKEEDILATFDWIKRNLGGVDVLVNNAGSGDYQTLLDGKTEGWEKQIDLGIIGVSICTREAIKSMRERQVDDGHIININSVAGHAVSGVPLLIMSSAIKHGLTVLTEGLRRELVASDSKIRVTSISPGLVRTEATLALEEHLGDTLIKDNPQLAPKDIADAILFCLGAPAHVQSLDRWLVGNTFRLIVPLEEYPHDVLDRWLVGNTFSLIVPLAEYAHLVLDRWLVGNTFRLIVPLAKYSHVVLDRWLVGNTFRLIVPLAKYSHVGLDRWLVGNTFRLIVPLAEYPHVVLARWLVGNTFRLIVRLGFTNIN